MVAVVTKEEDVVLWVSLHAKRFILLIFFLIGKCRAVKVCVCVLSVCGCLSMFVSVMLVEFQK